MKKQLLLFFGLLLALSSTCVVAQALHDPTRPQTGSDDKFVVNAPPPPPRLQMVLIGAERSSVVIDGEVLQAGEFFKGMQVQSIRPDAVVLKTRKGLRTLPLYAP